MCVKLGWEQPFKIKEFLKFWILILIFHFILQALQVIVQPVIEALINIDRQIWNQEQGYHTTIVPVFDCHISPRNLALVATKNKIWNISTRNLFELILFHFRWGIFLKIHWRNCNHIYHILFCLWGHCGHDHMVVGFTTTYAISAYHHWGCEFESLS